MSPQDAPRCALYCRLSREDRNRKDESESISNQRAILTAFAAAHGWTVWKIYIDEDMSGADGRRPGFLALLADAAAGRFSIVLCKSQSRFTRDMEAVEKYIHGSFRAWGVRFVSVVDGADTESRGNKKARQINGLVNEWYLEDLSENVRTVLDCKRAAGQYIGSFPLYGYLKDAAQRGTLCPDPDAAGTVRRIYALYLSGRSTRAIAAQLNAEGVPSPSAYKAAAYPSYRDTVGGWSRCAVTRILKNEMYTGVLIQGRQRKLSYKTAQRQSVPESAWMRVEGTHAPLISRAQFDAAQEILQRRTQQTGRTDAGWPLAGLVYCGGCGGPMTRTAGGKNALRSYLCCAAHKADSTVCTRHSVDAAALRTFLQERISAHLAAFPIPAEQPLPANTLEISRLRALETGLRTAGLSGQALREVEARLRTLEAPPAAAPSENALPVLTRALALALIQRVTIGTRRGDTQEIKIDYRF